MQFLSLTFTIFFLLVFLLYYSIGAKYKPLVLLLSSIFFISSFSPGFVIYSALFVLVNYSVAIGIASLEKKYVKLVYYFGQIFNILGLVLFKYANFIIRNINLFVEDKVGWHLPEINWLIPIGISYYTFQGISYLYLVLKAKDKPERNLVHFSIYILFWPKIISGPIERHRILLPQLKQKITFQYANIIAGGRLVLIGLYKKVVIGNTLGLIVTRVYSDIDSFEGISLLVVFCIQPIQLYYDFSGYTDIAIGFGRTLGINLSPNFNRPFLAKTVGEFWNRFHISLSSWCNDFIYNRLLLKHRKWGDKAIAYSLTMAFLILGIWHGANWTFIVLGLLQVIALMYEYFTRKWRKKIKSFFPSQLFKWMSRGIVYFFYSISLIFFFSNDLSDAWDFLYKMFTRIKLTSGGYGLGVISLGELILVTISLIVFYLIELKDEGELNWSIGNRLINLRVLRWLGYYILILLIFLFSGNDLPFVYGNF